MGRLVPVMIRGKNTVVVEPRSGILARGGGGRKREKLCLKPYIVVG